jgi:hypothetical protein
MSSSKLALYFVVTLLAFAAKQQVARVINFAFKAPSPSEARAAPFYSYFRIKIRIGALCRKSKQASLQKVDLSKTMVVFFPYLVKYNYQYNS